MTIKEVSEKYGLSPDTLRYYERVGLIPSVPRTGGGIRNYDETSCRWIELIKCMRKAGVQIEALIEYVNLFSQGEETVDARKALLLEQRRLLLRKKEDIEESISWLDKKIDRYEKGLMTTKEQLFSSTKEE